jgi:hypothetical protein
MNGVLASYNRRPLITKGDKDGRDDTRHRKDGSKYHHRPATHGAIAFDDLWAGRMGDVRTYRATALHSGGLCRFGLYPFSHKGTKAP